MWLPKLTPVPLPPPQGWTAVAEHWLPPKPTEQSLPKQRVATGERQVGPGHQEQPGQWLRTGPREVVGCRWWEGAAREWRLQGPSVCAPLSHRTLLTKPKVKGKITENFKMVTAEH